jgi:hypothetical protein
MTISRHLLRLSAVIRVGAGACALLVGVTGVASGGAAASTLPRGPVISTVYCPNQMNVDCSRVYGQGPVHYAHAPTGFDDGLGCRWYDTGYGRSLGEDKHYCVAPPGIVFFAQAQSPESPVYRPRQLDVAGDGSFVVKSVSWRSWGAQSATGRGSAGVDDCTPDCATGRFHYAPVTIMLTAPHKKCGIPEYTRAVFVFTHGVPAGRGVPDHYRWQLAAFPCGA